MRYELTLHADEIATGASMHFPPAARALCAWYVVSGSVRMRNAYTAAAFSANSAFFSVDVIEVTGGSVPAVVLRWELAVAGSRLDPRSSTDIASRELLSAAMDLDPARDYLLRLDRVDFPPGGVALRHTHAGGGIRCLLEGSIEIDTQGAKHTYAPLEAWFEAGPDPVFAQASATQPTAFARMMVLPRALLGKSSISYVNAEDLAKPKNQRYQIFIDAPLGLPQ